MAKMLSIQHERVDDVPLVIGLANQLRLAEILDTHLGTHGLQQGLNNGQLAVGWLGYILSQADHRKSAVRDWANGLSQTLAHLLGQPLREVDFADERLGGVLHRLSDDAAWAAIEGAVWAASVLVYELPLSAVRLDGSTTYGYHQPRKDGLMQFGRSKDHRPDLPQMKLMAAAAEPTGHLLACDVHPGQAAEDPLYTPLIQRVRGIVGRAGLLYTGDCKMAALATRAELVAHADFYLMPLPLTGQTATDFVAWVTAVVEGEQGATLVWAGSELLGAGYEFERLQTAQIQAADGTAQSVQWTERVQVVRSLALAQAQQATLEKHLQAACVAIRALTPEPGRGKRQFREEATLQAATQALVGRYAVEGLLTITWERQETTVLHYRGPGRPSAQRAADTQIQVRYVIREVQRNEAAIAARQWRLGWRAQVTNVPVAQWSLAAAVVHYRRGWVLERDFHLVKDLPLGLSPLFVWKDDQIKGLARLLTLALRLMTLIETQVRQGLAQTEGAMKGLYEGQAHRETAQPTAKRLLRAFAKAQITVTRIETDQWVQWHLTPLSTLHEQILHYLRLPLALYTELIPNSS